MKNLNETEMNRIFYLTWMKGIKGIFLSPSSPSSMLNKKQKNPVYLCFLEENLYV